MSRNWIRALRAASFRGVPFKVEYEDAEGARRLSVSPIAYAETSVIEDMGRDPRMVTLAAYVAGDLADAAAVQDLRSELRRLNPHAQIDRVSDGCADPACFLEEFGGSHMPDYTAEAVHGDDIIGALDEVFTRAYG